MRVAIIAHGVTDQSLLGGPGQVAAEHAQALSRAGHEVVVCTSNLVWKGQNVAAPTFGLLGEGTISVRWERAFSFSRWPGAIGPIICPGGRAMVLDAVRWADVVHGHEWPHKLVQTARALCQRRGVAFVVQPHGSIQIRNRGWKSLAHQAFNHVHPVNSRDNFIALTRTEASEIAAILGPRPSIFRMGNPVAPAQLREDDPLVAARRASWGFPDDATVILFCHRIVPNKGLDVMIRALADLPRNYCLAVVGQGYKAYGAACRSLVEELRLGHRVRFAGPVSRTRVEEVIMAADVFVLPARHDIFPLTVMQALACGRPVVLSSACQIADELHGAALIVEPHPVAIARAIASLIDEAARASMRTGAALVLEHYSPATVLSRLEDIYSQIVARRRVPDE